MSGKRFEAASENSEGQGSRWERLQKTQSRGEAFGCRPRKSRVPGKRLGATPRSFGQRENVWERPQKIWSRGERFGEMRRGLSGRRLHKRTVFVQCGIDAKGQTLLSQYMSSSRFGPLALLEFCITVSIGEGCSTDSLFLASSSLCTTLTRSSRQTLARSVNSSICRPRDLPQILPSTLICYFDPAAILLAQNQVLF